MAGLDLKEGSKVNLDMKSLQNRSPSLSWKSWDLICDKGEFQE